MDLVTRAGWIGQAKIPEHLGGALSGAHVLTDVTDKILTSFATPRAHQSFMGLDKCCTGGFNSDLKERVLQKIEMLASDAAADELVSSAEMRKPIMEEMQPLTPNVKAVIRDHAHGCRRLTRRGWNADPYLKNLFDTLITQKNSLLTVITNSPIFSQWMGEASKEQRTGRCSGVRKFAFAKHRHNSIQKPLYQYVLNVEAIIHVAQKY